jgi:hypothetical protein
MRRLFSFARVLRAPRSQKRRARRARATTDDDGDDDDRRGTARAKDARL